MGVFLLAGLFQLVLGVCRMGVYIRYVPYPVISGFMSGIGVIILVQQLFPFLGMVPPASDPWSIVRHLHLVRGNVEPERHRPRRGDGGDGLSPAPPHQGGAGLAGRAGDADRGGSVAEARCSEDWRDPVRAAGAGASIVRPAAAASDAPPALELALLGAIDSLLTSLVADNLTRTRHDSNRELFGQGVGNMVAGLIGGIPGAGATMRTVVNVNAGGKTRLSGVIHGLFLAAVLLGLSGLVQYIPSAVLAGLLVTVGIGIIDSRGFGHLSKVPRSDAFVMLFVLVLTVFTDLIVAVVAGLIVASFVFVKKVSDVAARQTTLSLVADEPWGDELSIPGAVRSKLLIKHVEGPLFFGFASQFLDIARQAASSKLLVLRMDRISYMDQTGSMRSRTRWGV